MIGGGSRMWGDRMWAPRYWAKVGLTPNFDPAWAVNSNQIVGIDGARP